MIFPKTYIVQVYGISYISYILKYDIYEIYSTEHTGSRHLIAFVFITWHTQSSYTALQYIFSSSSTSSWRPPAFFLRTTKAGARPQSLFGQYVVSQGLSLLSAQNCTVNKVTAKCLSENEICCCHVCCVLRTFLKKVMELTYSFSLISSKLHCQHGLSENEIWGLIIYNRSKIPIN